MKRSVSVILGLSLVALTADSAHAQRGRSGGVNTPYGHFSAAEMGQAGGNPLMAQQIREQKQTMLYEQQMLKEQQNYLKELTKRQDFLKKHPEAAKSLAAPVRAPKKSTSKSSKKDKKPPTDAAPSAETSTSKAKKAS